MVPPCAHCCRGSRRGVPSTFIVTSLYISEKPANTDIQIRLYSRDLELSNQNVLHREMVPSPVVILSLVDNSLLVYTADNTLYHYLIIPTTDAIKLHFCGSITFDGVIAVPSAVRALSWMIPSAQKRKFPTSPFWRRNSSCCRAWRPCRGPGCRDRSHDRRREACSIETSQSKPQFFILYP